MGQASLRRDAQQNYFPASYLDHLNSNRKLILPIFKEMVQALLIVFSVALQPLVAKAEDSGFRWTDPLVRETVQLSGGEYEVPQEPGSGQGSGQSRGVKCTLKSGARGSVLAYREVPSEGGNSEKSKALVVVNSEDWPRDCRTKPSIGFQPIVWVPSESLKKNSGKSEAKYGDLCQGYLQAEALEAVAILASRSEGGNCEGCSNQEINRSSESAVTGRGDGSERTTSRAVVRALALSAKAARDFEVNNPCLTDPRRQLNSPECSFKKLLDEAKKAGPRCVERQKELSCNHSPWRKLGIEGRFNEAVQLAVEKTKKIDRAKINYRAIPCIAIVETEYLEPMAKSLGACSDPQRNRYHGLGMLTLSTLNDYVTNPNRNVRIQSNRSKSSVGGRSTSLGELKSAPEDSGVDYDSGAFRSNHPEFSKPSYYACPGRLHDAMGASPELQVEMMAYTLADKRKLAENLKNTYLRSFRAPPGVSKVNEHDRMNWVTFALYNANTAQEAGGRPHYAFYADAVLACVTCLNSRLDEDGKMVQGQSPAVECLSYGLRASPAQGSPFHMKADKLIQTDFDNQIRLRCDKDPSSAK